MHLVLVEGRSRRSEAYLTGRTCTNKRVVFPDEPVPLPDASPGAVALAAWLEAGGDGAAGGGGGRAGGAAGGVASTWAATAASAPRAHLAAGEYVAVLVESGTMMTLRGRPLWRAPSLRQFAAVAGPAPFYMAATPGF